MSALTANNPSVVTNPLGWIEYLVAASTHIYQGARVCVNSSGYLVPAADTSGFHYAGVAMNEVNNSSGSAGAGICQVQPPSDDVQIQTIAIASTATQATVGVQVFLVDDQTVDIAANSTNKIAFGRVVKFLSAGWVQVDTFQRFTPATVA
jgi:hypothetical protein